MQIPIPELLDDGPRTRGGSDLHLTAGDPADDPRARRADRLERLSADLTPRRPPGMIYAILPQKLRERFEQELELDMSYSLPGKARFRVNVYLQRDAIGAAFRADPVRDQDLDDLGIPPASSPTCARLPAWLRRSSPGRPVRASRRRWPRMVDIVNRERAGPHHDRRGPDRVPAPAQALHRQPARGRCGHARRSPQALKHVLRQDPDVILVGEMRDLETISTAHHRGRDRPPGVRDAAHAGRAADDRPHHRRVPAAPAAAGPGAAGDDAAGRRHPAARARPPTATAGSSPPRCWSCTPAVRNLIREGKTHQIYSIDAGRWPVRDADDGPVARRRS